MGERSKASKQPKRAKRDREPAASGAATPVRAPARRPAPPGGRRARKAARAPERETELAAPVVAWLEAQGWTVRSEVERCDLVARRGDELVAVELKRRFETSLLVQAAYRQRAVDSVYVAIPRPPDLRSAGFQGVLHLLRRLELGLLVVSLGRTPRVQVAQHPAPFTRRRSGAKRRAILEEMSGRSGDWNVGGSTRRPLVTAYRESAIFVACALERTGEASPRRLRELGTGDRTRAILYDDVYGWFSRVGRALYALSPRGREELARYEEVAAGYRARLDEGPAAAAESTRATPSG